MRFRPSLSFLSLATAVLLAGSTVAATALADPSDQPPVRTIHGIVVDSTGGAIAGAKVTLKVGSGAGENQLTNAEGRFAFPDVPSGTGVLTVIWERFAPATLRVSAALQPELRVVLTPVPLSEQVTVRAELPETRITTATRTDTPLRDVPQAVSIVSREIIAEQSMQNMADVVRYVPGIGMAQGEGNRDAPIFRGNSSTSDFFVDGVRDDTQYFRDLYNIERVEAFKGPNAMIFGRGGVGGVINRVVRQAGWTPNRELVLQGGSWNDRRLSGDFGQGVNGRLAARVNGMYERSDSYRDGVGLERYGINPTLAFSLGPNTMIRAGYEFFHDNRTADRGVPSFNGAPVETDPSTFFGNAAASDSRVDVHALSSLVEHTFAGRATLRNRTRFANYDKFYQNIFPGAVNSAGTSVSLSGYNNGTERTNFFNQTDVVFSKATGSIEHVILAGVEVGRQSTDNLRNTAYFTSIGPNVTSVTAPLSDPTTSLPVEFRPGATDADNHGVATVAAVYAQDQMALTSRVQAIVGLRYDSFNVDFLNHRTGTDFTSHDGLVSPRVGLVFKPNTPVSLYASYSVSYLPRAGEQLSSLSLSNQALEPEEFRNYEVGTKWDVTDTLALSAAIYRLDRGNVIVPDPNDPTVSLLVDGQRTKGVELGLSGRVTRAWSVMAAYAYQDGEITRAQSATVLAGARLAQLPSHMVSIWNRYDVTSQIGIGLGIIHRGDMFAATDNAVTLPAVTRLDAGLFYTITPRWRVQMNVENLLDEEYFATAHSNNNITPGSPRAVRVALTTRF